MISITSVRAPLAQRRGRVWAPGRFSLLGAILLAASLTPSVSGAGAKAATPASRAISYGYDAAGRLTSVVDPAKGGAVYHYDRAGNIVAITREPAQKLAVLSVSPTSAAPGSTVTLTGAGFAASRAGDRVAFDGRPAPIISAGPTRIVTAVPAGFARGPVSVQVADRGSAVAPGAFSVQSSDVPAISDVSIAGKSDDVATAGTVITIRGSGFDPTPSHDVVRFNGTVAQPRSATSRALTVTVPPMAGSGPISVVTPAGLTTSSFDFYIPPSPYSASQVGAMGTATVGKPLTVQVPKPGVITLLTFRMKGNPRASWNDPNGVMAWLNDSTLSGYSMTLVNPDGSVNVGPDGFGTQPSALGGSLRDSGVYTLLLDPGNSSGSVQVTVDPDLNVQTSISAAASLPGNPVKVTTGMTGNNAQVAFHGTAGEKVSVLMSNSTIDGDWGLDTASGTDLEPNLGFAEGTNFLDRTVLPATGTYYIWVDPNVPELGSFTLNLFRIEDVHGSITESTTASGQPVTVTTTTPGQDADLNFHADAGQYVSVGLTSSTDTAYRISLNAPDGTQLSTNNNCATGSCFLDRTQLPRTGTYHLVLGHNGANTGIVIITLYRVVDIHQNVEESTSPAEHPTTVTMSIPGQDVYLDFKEQAGHYVSVTLTNSTNAGYQAALQAPDGRSVVSSGICCWGAGDNYFDRTQLPRTGTYQLLLYHNGANTGSTTVTVYRILDKNTRIVPGGSVVPVTIAIPGQNANLTFAGRTNHSATLSVISTTLPDPYSAAVFAPDGTLLASQGSSGGKISIAGVPLIEDGKYRVTIYHHYSNTGAVNVSLTEQTFHGAARKGGPRGLAPTSAPRGTGFYARERGARRASLDGALSGGARKPRHADIAEIPGDGGKAGDGRAQGSMLRMVARGHVQRPQRPRYPPVRVLDTAARSVSATGALIGSVRDDDGSPLSHVTITIEGQRVLTSRWGDFGFLHLPAGYHVLRVEGSTADRSGVSYGLFEIRVHVRPRRVTALGYVVWMPRLDTAQEVAIPSPTTRQLTLTTPRIPGLKIIIPAGAVVRDTSGRIVHRIGITPIPITRTPFPFPGGQVFPVYFTVQPGDATVIPARVKVIYPNVDGMPAGSRIPFWTYDPSDGWSQYGYGTVSPDRRSIVPDYGTYFSSFSGAGTPEDKPPPPPPPPPPCPGPCPCQCDSGGGDSPTPGPSPGPTPNEAAVGGAVDLSTGLDIVNQVDLSIPDVIPITIERTYRPNDPYPRYFGIGGELNYGLYVYPLVKWQQLSLVLPSGGQVVYNRVSPGNDQFGGVYVTKSAPGLYYDSRIIPNPFGGWNLELTNGTVYQFSSPNFNGPNSVLLSIIDRNRNVLSVHWDSAGGISGIRSPNGYWAQLSYLGNLYTDYALIKIQDDMGRAVSYSYNGSDLSSVTNADGAVTNYSITSSGTSLISITDARGHAFQTDSYDSNGRVIQQTLPDGTSDKIAYTTDGSGHITATTVTDPNGNVRRTTFNADGYDTSDTFGVGTHQKQTATYVRQPETNLLLSQTDALGRKTAYTYDAAGNVTSVTGLAGTRHAQTYRYTYNNYGETTSITDPLGHRTTYTFDAEGNLIAKSDALGHTWRYTYDSEGEPVTTTDPQGHTTTHAYQFGILASTTDPLGRTTRQLTDGAGRVVAVTDGLGNVTTRRYDAVGNLTSVNDPLGDKTTTTYNADNDPVSVTDPRGDTTYFTYDAMDRLCAQTDALARLSAPPVSCPTQATPHTTVYLYDHDGNLIEQIDRKGQITHYSYDALNRLIKTTYADGSTVTNTYDLADRLIRVVDSKSGTILNTYDGLDRLTSQTDPTEGVPGLRTVKCNGQMVTICYTYDKANRRASMAVSGQQAIRYTYDSDDNLTSETQGAGTVSCGGQRVSICMTYTADELPASTTLPDRVAELYAYDDANQITGIAYARGRGSTVCNTFRVAACLGTLTYGYDADGDRTSVGGSWARTSIPAPVSSATYNADNELTKWSSTSLSYDADGNEIADGSDTFTWNARNQLTGVSGPGAESFSYDGLGRQIGITEAGATTHMVYNGLNVVEKLDGLTPVATMLTGPALDQTFAQISGGMSRSLLTDALGSTVALADEAGTPTTRYTYDPYGDTTVSGAPSSNAAQFAGMQNDGSLYFDNARYYSTGLGRFTRQDPMGFVAGPNSYVYVSDRPTVAVDRTGLLSGGQWAFLGFVGVVAVVGVCIAAGPEAWAGCGAVARAAAAAFVAVKECGSPVEGEVPEATKPGPVEGGPPGSNVDITI